LLFEDRIVPVKEKTRAGKQEQAWAKGKAEELLQEEEGDAGEEYSFAGKGDEAVLLEHNFLD